MNQHHESVSLTAGIFLVDQKIMDQLWSVWDQMFKVPETNRHHQLLVRWPLSQHKITEPSVPVDGVNSQDGVPAHIAVTVLQAGPDRRHERLEQLRLLQLAQETQSGAADELIGMLQVLVLTERIGLDYFCKCQT